MDPTLLPYLADWNGAGSNAPPRLRAQTRLTACAVYVFLFFACAKNRLLSGVANDYLLTLATFLFLWILLSATRPAKPSVGAGISHNLARFSYTLYVVHIPFSLLVVTLAAGQERWSATLPHLFAGLGILLLTLAYAYGVAMMTEFHTDTLRRQLETKLNLKGPSPRISKALSTTTL